MSYQVGAFCFASLGDSGAAACSRFVPVSSVDGVSLRTVSCESSDPVTGALNLKISVSPLDGSASSYSAISQQIAFSDCQESQYWEAFSIFAGVIITAWALVWCGWKVASFLGFSRGEQ